MFIRNAVLTTSLIAFSAASLFAQELRNEGPAATTALINVESKNGTPLDPSQLKLEVNGHESPITSVVPVQPGAAQVAILIDDGARGGFNLQIKDIQNFIMQLPRATQVFVGYMQNGRVAAAGNLEGFTTNHEAAAGQIRISMSNPGISASPYFCLSDFVKHWPSNEPAARFVLMITNGVDPYNGRPSVLNQNSPYVEEAQNDAQRAGVAVYSIYFPDAGIRGGGAAFSGQSYLQQVGDATGGQSLYTGTFPPVNFKPFLTAFQKAMAESYTVSFMASTHKENNNTLTRIKLKTTQSGVKIHAPDSVHPGVTQVSMR